MDSQTESFQLPPFRFWRCGRCHLIFKDSLHHLELSAEKTRYDQHNNDVEDSGYRRFLTPVHDVVKRSLPAWSKGLDFGCGPGPLLMKMLTESGFVMRAWDPIYAADPAVLGGSYDFITCTEAAEHFYRPASEFARLEVCLKPHGFLVVMTSLYQDMQSFRNWYYWRDPTHVCFYHAKTWQWLGEHSSLRLKGEAAQVSVFQRAAK